MGKVIKGPWPAVFDSEVNLLSPKNDLEWVAFDTETTGFKNSDRIVEIGFVVFKNGEILEEWSTLNNPQRDVGATNIHGITASMVSTAPLFEDVINDIFRIINNRILTSHNFSFDSRLLAQEFKRANTQGSLGKGFCTMIQRRGILLSSNI